MKEDKEIEKIFDDICRDVLEFKFPDDLYKGHIAKTEVYEIIKKHWQQIMQKFNEIRKDALEDGSLGLIKKSDLQLKSQINQERQKTIEMIDKEKDIVKVCCLGLVHPDQTNQEEFTKWLQDTVIFHLEDLKKKVEKR